MQEVEYKTNQQTPSQPTGRETSSGEAFDFRELKERPTDKYQEILKKGTKNINKL